MSLILQMQNVGFFMTGLKYCQYNLSFIAITPVFRVCDQVRKKPDCRTTFVDWSLEISDLGIRTIVLTKHGADQLCICCFFGICKTRFSITWLIFILIFAFIKYKSYQYVCHQSRLQPSITRQSFCSLLINILFLL